ncbi:MAG: glycosyltransferase [Acidobacteriota bacterium]|nr:glycosyltransferase [Acidobacteriota bacterium]
MKILFCNKYNYPFSGTETYLFEVMGLLRGAGHQAELFSMEDVRGEPTAYDHHFLTQIDFKSTISNPVEKARLAATAIYSREARQRLRRMIIEFRPDVAHIRNIYHHLSPSILWELKAQSVPIVYHLNDFKLICPSFNMVSKGRACDKCQGGNFWHVVAEGCYPGPKSSAIALAGEAYAHKWAQSYQNCVTQFLAPSCFVKDKLVANGWDAAKIEVLSHFQTLSQRIPVVAARNAPVLYFGRLSPEKGLDILLQAAEHLPHIKFQIAGAGPQRIELENRARNSAALKNVEFVGHISGPALQGLIEASRFTVFPSLAYETFGKSILESYAWSRPVIASDLGSRTEIVQNGRTGLLFAPGSAGDLIKKIAFLDQRPALAAEMGSRARKLVAEEYRPETHLTVLTALYERLLPLSCTAAITNSKLPGMKSKMRVAFIGGRGLISKYSGIETYYEEVGRHIAEIGHEVTVYCRMYFTPKMRDHHGMRLVRLPTIRSKHLETLLHTLLSTFHAIFSDCDIIHYHALGPAMFSFLPRLFGKKTVVSVQGLDWQRKKWGRFAATVLHFAEGAAARFPNATIVVSKTLQQQYQATGSRGTIYIPNGTSLRKARSSRRLAAWGLAANSYVLFLGRFSPEKNCHLLIEAYKRLGKTPVKLVLAGGSSYSDAYSTMLRANQDQNIRILDWLSGDALDELIVNAMLFVLPSDVEGLSLALLDAMGAGICVLTSDIPENLEVVHDVGFTFRSGDLGDLERMLRMLIADPLARREAASKARQRVEEQYLWSRVARRTEEIYRSVMLDRQAVRRPAIVVPSEASRAVRAA